MRKLILGLSLVLLTGSAFAKWTRLGGPEGMTFYADLATVRVSGNTVKMWTLVDYSQPVSIGSINYLSRVTLSEYDCVERRSRILQVSAFTGQMRTGDSRLTSTTPADWQYAEPESGSEHLLNVACKAVRRK